MVSLVLSCVYMHMYCTLSLTPHNPHSLTHCTFGSRPQPVTSIHSSHSNLIWLLSWLVPPPPRVLSNTPTAQNTWKHRNTATLWRIESSNKGPYPTHGDCLPNFPGSFLWLFGFMLLLVLLVSVSVWLSSPLSPLPWGQHKAQATSVTMLPWHDYLTFLLYLAWWLTAQLSTYCSVRTVRSKLEFSDHIIILFHLYFLP